MSVLRSAAVRLLVAPSIARLWLKGPMGLHQDQPKVHSGRMHLNDLDIKIPVVKVNVATSTARGHWFTDQFEVAFEPDHGRPDPGGSHGISSGSRTRHRSD